MLLLVGGDEGFVDRHVVIGHAQVGEALFEAFADAGAVDGVDFAGGFDGAGHVVDDEAGEAVLDDFGDRAAAECDDRGAAGHGFDHDEAKAWRGVAWLRAVCGRAVALAWVRRSRSMKPGLSDRIRAASTAGHGHAVNENISIEKR